MVLTGQKRSMKMLAVAVVLWSMSASAQTCSKAFLQNHNFEQWDDARRWDRSFATVEKIGGVLTSTLPEDAIDFEKGHVTLETPDHSRIVVLGGTFISVPKTLLNIFDGATGEILVSNRQLAYGWDLQEHSIVRVDLNTNRLFVSAFIRKPSLTDVNGLVKYSGIRLVDLVSGQVKALKETPSLTNFQLSPDGSQIIASTVTNILILDAKDLSLIETRVK